MQTVTDTLTAERTVAFIDYHNTREALRRAGHQIDLLALRDYIAEGRHLIETFVYLITDPLEADDAARARLQEHGFLILEPETQVSTPVCREAAAVVYDNPVQIINLEGNNSLWKLMTAFPFSCVTNEVMCENETRFCIVGLLGSHTVKSDNPVFCETHGMLK